MSRAEQHREAKNNPVVMSNIIDTEQQEIGNTEIRNLKSTGPAREALDPLIIPATEMPADDEQTLMLAFMNEPITIKISTTTDMNAEQVFEVNLGGRPYFFRRGEEVTVPRFVVDFLCRLKVTTYTQVEAETVQGDKYYQHIPHTSLKYDFHIIKDVNPLGSQWFKAALAGY